MGAITKIRQISPYFLAVIAVLFIAFMVIQDSGCDNINQAQRSPENVAVATVNGDKITLAEFERRVREVLDAQRQQDPTREVDDEAVRQQVYDEMVNELLRKQEAAKLGLAVTEAQIIDVMVINPPEQLQFFKDSTGKFDKALYQQLVTNPDYMAELLARQKAPQEEIDRQVALWKKTLFDIEDNLRIQMLQQALATTVGAAGSVPSPTEAEFQYRIDNSTADVRFVAIPTTMINDNAVKVTDEEVSAYYEQNKQYYTQKQSRAIKFMVFPQIASQKDTQQAAKRSQALAEALAALPTVEQKDSAFSVAMSSFNGVTTDYATLNNVDPMAATVLTSLQIGEVFGPLNTAAGITYMRLDGKRDGVNPTVRASHILIPFGTNKDSAKAETMKLLARAKKEDFAELARVHSKDPGSAQQGGDLNFFTKGRMVPEFENAAFGAGVGDVVGPIETQFGFHIIKVTDRQSTELKFSQIVIKPTLSTSTKQQIMAKAQKAADEITNGSPIDSVAAKLKIPVQSSQIFTKESPILSSRELTAWAFDNEKGAVTRKDVKYYGTVVAQVSETREVGVKPLEDVKEKIRTTLLQRKKLDALKAKAEQVASAAQQAGTVDAASTVDPTLTVGEQLGVKDNGMLPGYGGEFAATAAAYKLAPGSISKAIRGERAWFVLQLIQKNVVSAETFAKDRNAAMQTQSARLRNNAFYSWFQKLRENAEIEDLRNKQN